MIEEVLKVFLEYMVGTKCKCKVSLKFLSDSVATTIHFDIKNITLINSTYNHTNNVGNNNNNIYSDASKTEKGTGI